MSLVSERSSLLGLLEAPALGQSTKPPIFFWFAGRIPTYPIVACESDQNDGALGRSDTSTTLSLPFHLGLSKYLVTRGATALTPSSLIHASPLATLFPTWNIDF